MDDPDISMFVEMVFSTHDRQRATLVMVAALEHAAKGDLVSFIEYTTKRVVRELEFYNTTSIRP